MESFKFKVKVNHVSLHETFQDVILRKVDDSGSVLTPDCTRLTNVELTARFNKEDVAHGSILPGDILTMTLTKEI